MGKANERFAVVERCSYHANGIIEIGRYLIIKKLLFVPLLLIMVDILLYLLRFGFFWTQIEAKQFSQSQVESVEGVEDAVGDAAVNIDRHFEGKLRRHRFEPLSIEFIERLLCLLLSSSFCYDPVT